MKANLTPRQRADVYQKALLNTMRHRIQRPVLKNMLGTEKFDKQTIKKILETPEYKQACEKRVREVVMSPSTEATLIKATIAVEITKVKGIA